MVEKETKSYERFDGVNYFQTVTLIKETYQLLCQNRKSVLTPHISLIRAVQYSIDISRPVQS